MEVATSPKVLALISRRVVDRGVARVLVPAERSGLRIEVSAATCAFAGSVFVAFGIVAAKEGAPSSGGKLRELS